MESRRSGLSMNRHIRGRAIKRDGTMSQIRERLWRGVNGGYWDNRDRSSSGGYWPHPSGEQPIHSLVDRRLLQACIAARTRTSGLCPRQRSNLLIVFQLRLAWQRDADY